MQRVSFLAWNIPSPATMQGHSPSNLTWWKVNISRRLYLMAGWNMFDYLNPSPRRAPPPTKGVDIALKKKIMERTHSDIFTAKKGTIINLPATRNSF